MIEENLNVFWINSIVGDGYVETGTIREYLSSFKQIIEMFRSEERGATKQSFKLGALF